MAQEDFVTAPLHTREGQGVGMFFPSYYLAPISYYARLAHETSVRIDLDEPYSKQTLRNRCYIASPNGPLALTIPVVKFVPYHTPMRDIRISDHGDWRHLHWNALVSSYRRTPFFEYYADDFAPFYEKKWEFLVDYNQALQDLVCEEIGLMANGQIQMTNDKGLTTNGQRPYYQLFSDRNGFMPDLSIVDLLFNLGPEALLYLLAP